MVLRYCCAWLGEFDGVGIPTSVTGEPLVMIIMFTKELDDSGRYDCQSL